jgi:toxin ParE1/3/4
MAYLVEVTVRAPRDLEILYLEKHAADSQVADRWYNGLGEAISTLTAHPHRCPIAPETRRTKRQLRHLLYGKRPHVYRIIYEIQEQTQTVKVATIRHAARRKAQVNRS